MSFLNRLFHRDAESATRAEYQQLLKQADKAALPADRARLLNLAGDLALSLGDEAGALEALGVALDTHLRDRDYHSARAIARKLLRMRSSTVRVRSTLAWLAIAQDQPDEARVALDLYVTALRMPAEREHAVRHLTAMSRASADVELRAAVAGHLDTLGAPRPAAEIRSALAAEAAGTAEPPGPQTVRARWEDALEQLISPARS